MVKKKKIYRKLEIQNLLKEHLLPKINIQRNGIEKIGHLLKEENLNLEEVQKVEKDQKLKKDYLNKEKHLQVEEK